MAPYQERPQVHPLEFRLHVDPKTEAGRVYPLLFAVGETKETATNTALAARLAGMEVGLAETSIRQLRAKGGGGEMGLVAGFYASGVSARPGFGWFFGRDALYPLY